MQEADDTLQKLLQTHTMQMTVFLANTPTQSESAEWPGAGTGGIGLHRMQTKWSACVLIKKISPL